MLKLKDLVSQKSTTIGTADFTLSPTGIAGYLRFEDAVLPDEFFTYAAHGITAGGVRTGEFETGVGRLVDTGAAFAVERCMVLSNSAGSAPDKLAFSSGDKVVSVALLGAQANTLRMAHAAEGDMPVIYVRSTGNDANSGFSSDSGGALATLQAAVDLAGALFAVSIIDVGAGSFGSVYLEGSDINVSIVGAGRSSTTIGAVVASGGARVGVFNALVVNGSGVGIVAEGAGTFVELGLYDDAANTISFGACSGGHMLARFGGRIRAGDYHVAGGCSAGAHLKAYAGGVITTGGEHTVDANITLSGGWANCSPGGGYIDFTAMATNTFTLGGHTVTGPRYAVNGPSVIDSGGGGATFLPGTTSGSGTGVYL